MAAARMHAAARVCLCVCVCMHRVARTSRWNRAVQEAGVTTKLWLGWHHSSTALTYCTHTAPLLLPPLPPQGNAAHEWQEPRWQGA